MPCQGSLETLENMPTLLNVSCLNIVVKELFLTMAVRCVTEYRILLINTDLSECLHVERWIQQ